jgi:thioredoxin-dependent peroxiredoxin
MHDARRANRTLGPGDPLPEFEGRTASGGRLGRTDLLGRPSVVFFYPKAGSPGCSVESREFARHHPEFVASGVRVVGISVDRPEAQQRFREACDLPFDLVADSAREISKKFGVLGTFGLARRTTFVAGPDGTILRVIRTWRPGPHVTGALEEVAGLPAGRDAGDEPREGR